MKKFTTLKTLLVGLLACAATSVWAQTTTLMEYGTSDVAWSADSLAKWTAGGNPTIKDGYVEITGGNGSYETSKTIAPTSNAIINVQAVWRGRSNTGRAWDKGNGSYFRYGNIVVAQNDQSQNHGYTFTGLSTISGVKTFSAGPYRKDIGECTWLLIEMEINTAENTLTSFTIKSEDGKHFRKNAEIAADFESSEAYSVLFSELCTSAEAATAFIAGILPMDATQRKDLLEKAKNTPLPESI